MPIWPENWDDVLLPSTPVVEIIVRGTVVYLALFMLLRFVLRREKGSLEITDLLVVVLLADAAQNAMAGSYTSLPDGIILVSTILFWAYTLNWLGYHFPWIQRFVHPRPLPLVKDGRMLRRNMKKELVTEDELMSYLREEGVDGLDEVQEAYMEGDGRISVIRNDREPSSQREDRAS